jgi:hypothetical protein
MSNRRSREQGEHSPREQEHEKKFLEDENATAFADGKRAAFDMFGALREALARAKHNRKN